MVATFVPSLLPLPSGSHPTKDVPYVSPVGFAVAAARRLSNALPYQWQYSFDKDATLPYGGFSTIDLGSDNNALHQKKPQEAMPNQLCPGGFPIISAGDFDDDVRFDPLETSPSLLPSHRNSMRRPTSSRSSLSDLSDDLSCHTADVLSLAPDSLLLDLHDCRDASKVGCFNSELEQEYQFQQAQEVLLSSATAFVSLTSTASSSKAQLRRKSFPRRFLGTSLERSPRQLSLFSSWTGSSFESEATTPELQAPGWKQVDYFATPSAVTASLDEAHLEESECEMSDDDGACFTRTNVDQTCQPFDRRSSNVPELDSLRSAGGVGLEGRARAMSHPW